MGGTKPLEGTVTCIEPSGFTKVSALGVEGQRVTVLATLKDVPTAGEAVVGEGYRVKARISATTGDLIALHPGDRLRPDTPVSTKRVDP